MIWTVFPKNTTLNESYSNYVMPQDFPSKEEAEAWADECKEYGIETEIDWNEGECV